MHRTARTTISALLTLVLVGVGCSKSEDKKLGETPAKPQGAVTGAIGDAPATIAPATVAPVPTGPTGTIEGKVILDGTPPKMDPLPRQSDPICAKDSAVSNFVVVGQGGGLKDVLVRIPVGKAKGPAPSAPATIDQKSCMYAPHVLGIMTGQQINVLNSDMTTHNIHTYVGDETKFNDAQPPGAAPLHKSIEAEAGEVMKFMCDVHKWMEAHVVVTDHPFFQVTGDDGAWKLAAVPVGTYEIEGWHPHLGAAKKISVTVEAGKAAQAELHFSAADYKP